MQSLEERLNAQLQEADHSIEIKNSIIREDIVIILKDYIRKIV